MVDFPPQVDGKPVVVSIQEYDNAEWAQQTAIDSTPNGYAAINMNDHTHIVATFDKESENTLDIIFNSAKKQYVKEHENEIKKDIDEKFRNKK